jgi:hypothetical protein
MLTLTCAAAEVIVQSATASAMSPLRMAAPFC